MFNQTLGSGIVRTLAPYVTSDFQSHSLTATTTIIATLAGGLFWLPYAKLMDIWGRPQGFALMTSLATVGLVMMAACQNVETYCASQVFYQVGTSGIQFTIIMFVTDTSTLRNRAFVIGLVFTPQLATVWAGGPIAERMLKTIGFRWGFGIWSILTPLVCLPLFLVFWYGEMKAKKAGRLPRRPTKRTLWQSVVYYLQEFDVLGLLLIVTGLSLFLLSFNLYSRQRHGWSSPLIICFIIIGGLLVLAFGLYEKYLAPTPFVPWELLRNRNVIFTIIMVVALYTADWMWNAYYYSMLIVVHNRTVSQASYINNIYQVGSTTWGVVIGVALRHYGHIKHYMLFFALPITMLGTGLMIKFRMPQTDIGYVAMCQILFAVGGGTIYPIEQIVLMASSPQQHIPAVLAVEYMVIQIGMSIGSTVATAIWTSVFADKLAEFLPASALPHLSEIYGSLNVQSSYPVGSPERLAIDHAYGDTQRIILIVATCLLAISLGAVVFWQDLDVKHMKPIRGRYLARH